MQSSQPGWSQQSSEKRAPFDEAFGPPLPHHNNTRQATTLPTPSESATENVVHALNEVRDALFAINSSLLALGPASRRSTATRLDELFAGSSRSTEAQTPLARGDDNRATPPLSEGSRDLVAGE